MSPTGDLHVTFIFLGEVPFWACSEVLACCTSIARRWEQHTLLGNHGCGHNPNCTSHIRRVSYDIYRIRNPHRALLWTGTFQVHVKPFTKRPWQLTIEIHRCMSNRSTVDCTCTGSFLQWFFALTHDKIDHIKSMMMNRDSLVNERCCARSVDEVHQVGRAEWLDRWSLIQNELQNSMRPVPVSTADSPM